MKIFFNAFVSRWQAGSYNGVFFPKNIDVLTTFNYIVKPYTLTWKEKNGKKPNENWKNRFILYTG